MSPKFTAIAAKSGSFGLIPVAVLADMLAVSAFSVNDNLGATIGALLGTVALIWAIIKWVDERIAEKLKQHNDVIVLKLAAQDATATANQNLLLEKLAGVNKQLEQPGRRH